NLFDSSVFDTEISSDQFDEHYSARNLNPLSSEQEIEETKCFKNEGKKGHHELENLGRIHRRGKIELGLY
ncbi:C14orf39 isoform 1, partial [Pongo abelii]